MEAILFFVFAGLAVVCAVNLVVQTHPISSALSLIGVMGSLAVLYLLLGAEFIAMAQVIVYAGAIMVLFIFVIMLLNVGQALFTRYLLPFEVTSMLILIAIIGAIVLASKEMD